MRMSTLARAIADGDSLLGESSDWDEAAPTATPTSPTGSVGSGQRWEIERSRIEKRDQLGEGMFGEVHAGVVTGLFPHEATTQVAIKQLNEGAAEDVAKEFSKEARVMQKISECDQMVKLLGVCTVGQPLMMLMELMPRGDLKTALRASRPKIKKASSLGMQALGQMLCDIAAGMLYLATKNVVHRDLAARNCLVAEDYAVKIGDFGLTRQLYSKEYYKQTGNDVLPIRWMAPEALQDGTFTTAGDVWSFGVVLWEVVTFAKLPYGLWTNAEVFDHVCEEEYRLPQPKENCPDGLYAVAVRCWAEEPADRVKFKDILAELKRITPTLDPDPILHRKAAKKKVPVPEPKAVEEDARSIDSFEAAGYMAMLDMSGNPKESFYTAVADLPDESEYMETLPPSSLKRSATRWIKPPSEGY